MKYQVRKEATTNSSASRRIGPEARTRCAEGVAIFTPVSVLIGHIDSEVLMVQYCTLREIAMRHESYHVAVLYIITHCNSSLSY